LILHVLLHQTAALFLYSFILMFLYLYTCYASQNFIYIFFLTVHLRIILVGDQLVRQVGHLPELHEDSR